MALLAQRRILEHLDELFFYLAFPLLLLGTLRRGGRVLVIPIALTAVAVDLAMKLHLSPVESAPGVTAWGVLYIAPLTRLLEFATGIVAYRIAMARPAQPARAAPRPRRSARWRCAPWR